MVIIILNFDNFIIQHITSRLWAENCNILKKFSATFGRNQGRIPFTNNLIKFNLDISRRILYCGIVSRNNWVTIAKCRNWRFITCVTICCSANIITWSCWSFTFFKSCQYTISTFAAKVCRMWELVKREGGGVV